MIQGYVIFLGVNRMEVNWYIRNARSISFHFVYLWHIIVPIFIYFDIFVEEIRLAKCT